MMESRLTPEQLRGAGLVQDTARAHGMNVYLTGGAVRDIISGQSIRDLDFTVQGNPLKLQKDLEKNGVITEGVDEELRVLYLMLPGDGRAEVAGARSEKYDKPGKPTEVTPATINEDLRRRDFTVNAMALSLNPGSRGLLLDPFNGSADIEAKLLRILHNYAFLEEPSRLMRATRLAGRFHWTLEERTQARYNAAKENNYIESISDRAIGHEIMQLAHEDDPLHILKALEKEDWLKALSPHWTVAKVDTAGLSQLMKTRQQMADLGYAVDPSPAILHFLTRRLEDREIAQMQKLIPRRALVESWRNLEQDARELARKLTSREAATPSLAWKLLAASRTEAILFLEVTARQQAVAQKIKNFFGKWRQVKQKLPLPEMAELRITPELPEYPKLAEEAFYLLLDGKLRSRTETIRFLKPYSPPEPAPPPPKRRGKKVAPPAEAAAAAGGRGKIPTLAAEAASQPPAPKLRGRKRKLPAEEAAQVARKVAVQVPAAVEHPSAPPRAEARGYRTPGVRVEKAAPAKPQPAPAAQKPAPAARKSASGRPAKKKKPAPARRKPRPKARKKAAKKRR